MESRWLCLDIEQKDLDNIIFSFKFTSYDPITTVDKNFTKMSKSNMCLPKKFWADTFWIWMS